MQEVCLTTNEGGFRPWLRISKFPLYIFYQFDEIICPCFLKIIIIVNYYYYQKYYYMNYFNMEICMQFAVLVPVNVQPMMTTS